MTDSCKYRFRFYTKNPKPKYDKTTLKSWQINVQKYPVELEKNRLYKVWEKNVDRIYAEVVLICVIHVQTTFIPAI